MVCLADGRTTDGFFQCRELGRRVYRCLERTSESREATKPWALSPPLSCLARSPSRGHLCVLSRASEVQLSTQPSILLVNLRPL